MNSLPPDDAMTDRCLLYLLAEMPADQADRFQQELIGSDRLRACLLQQAELIAALGTALPHPAAAAVTGPAQPAPQPALPALQPALPAPQPAATVPHRAAGGWVAGVVVALAASLLLLIALDRSAPIDPADPSDSVRLAHAWASARTTADRGVDAELPADADFWDGDAWMAELGSGGLTAGDVGAVAPNRSASTARRAPDTEAAGAGQDAVALPDAAAAEPSGVAASALGPPEWLIVAVRAADADHQPAADASEVNGD